MKVFAKNAMIKKILIVFITIIMTSNFIMPNYVCAANPGEQLVSGFFYLLSYVGDAAISIMQKIMIGDGDIESGGKYTIKYSPGMIFSDKVAGLKVNFLSAKEEDKTKVTLTTDPDNTDELKNIIVRMNTKIREGKISPEYVGTLSYDGSNKVLVWNPAIGTDINQVLPKYELKESNNSYTNIDLQNVPIISTWKSWPVGWRDFTDNEVDKIFNKDKGMYLAWCYNRYLYIYDDPQQHTVTSGDVPLYNRIKYKNL